MHAAIFVFVRDFAMREAYVVAAYHTAKKIAATTVPTLNATVWADTLYVKSDRIPIIRPYAASPPP